MRDFKVSFPKPCDEPWEAMAPAGCDRICARCDKVIHDLSNYDLAEAEALLRRDPDTCVRATIGADGVVALKPGRGLRRMVAVAATAGLLAAAIPAIAQQGNRPKGAIAGKIAPDFGLIVTATGPGGTTKPVKVRGDGRFKIRYLPPGTYTLTFLPSCGDAWTVENVVVVADRRTVVPDTGQDGGCIVVGQLKIEDGKRAG